MNMSLTTSTGRDTSAGGAVKAMAKHQSYSIEFKRQVAQAFISGETLHALSRRHDVSRKLIRIRHGGRDICRLPGFQSGGVEVERTGGCLNLCQPAPSNLRENRWAERLHGPV
jgi:hypothetical protein